MSNQLAYPFIAIEGNIGAGKTTLCKMLSEEYGTKLILEQFSDNPFLPFFYQNQERYAFPVELFFMTERHKQLQEHLTQQDLFHQDKGVIADYLFVKTVLFAKINLSDDEYRLFNRLFTILNASFPKPDLIVYLHRSVPKLLENIQKRGRQYEQEIEADYLTKIQNAYFDYFRIDPGVPILLINVEHIDFLNNRHHYEQMKEALSRKYTPGLHQLSILF